MIKAVNADNGMVKEDLEINTMEQQVAAFLQEKGINFDCSNIEASLPLPMKKIQRHRGTNIFINEHPTKHNVDIARKA